MTRPKLLLSLVPLFLIAGIGTAQPDIDPAMLEMLSGWKESLNLSEEQSGQVKSLLQQMSAKLDPIADQMDQEGEVDKKAAFGQLKQIRQQFQTDVMKVLNPEQQQAMTQMQAQIDKAALTKVAGKRAEKLQGQFSLSPEQTQKVVPVYVKQMTELGAFMEKAKANSGEQSEAATKGGKRRQRRGKLKQAKGLKSISEDADKAIKGIMTSDQWAAYKTFRDQQKEANKAKLKAKKG